MSSMALIEGFDHQSGVHCGATAVRSVTQHYGWNYTEAATFGVGGGPAFVHYTDPETPWGRYRTSPIWLEQAFFERVGIPHLFREGDDFEMAWANVASRIDEGDPVILFLDPEPLGYLPEAPGHLPPHVAVLVGYDDDTVTLSDAALDSPQDVSRETLRAAWSSDGFVELQNEYLVVTRAARTADGTDSAAAGLRQSATYMLDPLHIQRNARGPGQEGLAAVRAFADELGGWADLPEPNEPVRAAKRAIDEHGDGAAFRALFAESLAELGQRTGLPASLADRMDRAAEEWRTVADILGDIVEEGGSRRATFEEAASVVSSVADHEEALYEDLAAELGTEPE